MRGSSCVAWSSARPSRRAWLAVLVAPERAGEEPVDVEAQLLHHQPLEGRVVGVAMGVGGAEFFAHPWELGVRKAKEFLFTADWLSATEAHRLGMVNHVVPRAELEVEMGDTHVGLQARPYVGIQPALAA